MTLDGTFHVDAAGRPWFVYAHEWIQITNGSFEALPMRDDLVTPIGDPVVLFRAGEVGWTKREIRYRNADPVPGIVTDGRLALPDEERRARLLLGQLEQGPAIRREHRVFGFW